jgi:hypothetical protein
MGAAGGQSASLFDFGRRRFDRLSHRGRLRGWGEFVHEEIKLLEGAVVGLGLGVVVDEVGQVLFVFGVEGVAFLLE